MTYKELYEYQKEITLKQREVINRQKAEIENLKMVLDAVEDHLHPLPFELDYDKAIERAKAEAIKEFAEKVSQTLGMLNAKELAGTDSGNDDIYYQQNSLAWTRGSTTARNEAIAIISNTKKEMVSDV